MSYQIMYLVALVNSLINKIETFKLDIVLEMSKTVQTQITPFMTPPDKKFELHSFKFHVYVNNPAT